MANYWDKQGGGGNNAHNPYAPTALKKLSMARPDEDVLGNFLLEQLGKDPIANAIGYDPQNTKNSYQPDNTEMARIQQQLAGIPDMKAPGGLSRGLDLGLDIGSEHLGDGVGDAAGAYGSDLASQVGSMFGWGGDSEQGGPGQFQDSPGIDPQSLLTQLRSQYGEYKYGGPSAETMASREFDPQFAALNAEKSATNTRFGENSKQLSGLYGALKNDTLAGRGQNAAAYKQSGADINKIYGDASGNVTKNSNASTAEIGKQLALLNQGEAAPAVFDDSQKVLNEQLGSLASAQGTSAALNTQLGANTYAADTDRVGIVGQAGANAQADLQGQREQLMQQYAGQNMQLQSQKGKAQNQYGMSIEELIQQGKQGIDGAVNDAFKTIMNSNDNERDRALKIQQLQQGANQAYAELQQKAQSTSFDQDLRSKQFGLDEQKFGFDSLQKMNKTGTEADTSKMNPYDALLSNSGKYNPDSQQEAANDAEIVYKTGVDQPGAQNMQQLMNALEENSPGWLAQPGNKAIAYDYFNRLLSQSKR